MWGQVLGPGLFKGEVMKVRKIRISTQIFLMLLIGTFVGVGVLSSFMYLQSRAIILSQVRDKAENYASAMAGAVSPEAFAGLSDQEDVAYATVYRTLSILRDNSNAEYIYALTMNDAGELVYALDTDVDEPMSYGEPFGYDQAAYDAYEGVCASDEEVSVDEWGAHLSAFAPVTYNGVVVGLVGVDISYSDVESALQKVRIGTLFISCVIICCLLLILTYITRKLGRYFNKLNQKVIELADGDLSKQVEFHSGDEMEVIAGNINKFIQVVRGLVQQVASSSKNNAGTIGNMNADVLQMSANMEECSATAETVSAYLSEVVEQMNALAASVNDTNDFVGEEQGYARESQQLATSHRQDAVVLIEEINENIKAALEQARVISKVSEMADEINDIARQTRILSINAQIEAARAGELGQGFAVVAMEIAELSGHTAEAVEEIANINATVQSAMKNLREYVENMNRFMTTNVVGDYEAFEKLGMDYGRTTARILERMNEVRTQSEEISHMVESVNSSVHDISMAIADSADQVENFTSETSDIADSMDKLLMMKILSGNQNES